MRRGPFFTLFAISGAAALIYEVIWTRLLTLEMGHTVAAVSTVLAAFMGGLAIGSAIGGRVGSRLSPERALQTYAGLEIVIALFALLLPLGLQLLNPLLASTYASGSGGGDFAVLRLVSSAVLLAAPAAAMGATFPIASRWTVRLAARAATDAGALYAANTIGAAAGALLAGFVLIPTLGMRMSTLVGVMLNIVAAAGALAIARGPIPVTDTIAKAPSPSQTRRRRPEVTSAAAERVFNPWLASTALGVSGFASLTLQIVWTRLLAMILGPTTYAFSLVVAVFIIGIAGGSAIGGRVVARSRQPAVALSFVLSIGALCSLAAAWAVDWALITLAVIVARPDLGFNELIAREALLVIALLLPVTLTFGAAFPFGVALSTGRDELVTENLGRLYAINTVGAIAGSLVAGFALVPAFGLHLTIRGLAALVAVGASIFAIVGSPRRASAIRAVAVAGVVVVSAWALPQWDRLLLSSGAYKYALGMRGADLESALSAGELLFYQEGASGTVAVRRLAGTVSLAIDGKVDASNAGDMLTQRLLAHLPLLLHPNPQRVAILGLGSGVTLGSALTHSPAEALVLEISPEVVSASRFFDEENHRALENPRSRLIVGDGRTHLLFGREQYDVIVSEPSNPWMAGIASLFTREFFEAARARLAPGGLLCQWAHTYDISANDLRSIVGTFLSVFPDGTLWLVGDADVLLIGSTESLDSRIAGVASTWRRPGVAEDLASVEARDPFSVQSLFVASGPALAEWVGNAPPQVDDRLALEFSGPRSIVGARGDDNAQSLRELSDRAPKPSTVQEALRSATSVEWRNRGVMFLRADAHRPAYRDLVRALESDPDDQAALDGLIRAAGAADRVDDSRNLLTRLAAQPGRSPAKLALSRLLAAQGAIDEAVRIPLGLLQVDPANVPALEQLASVLSDAGDAERLAPVVYRLTIAAPSSTWTHYYAAALAFLRDRPADTLREAQLAVSADPGNARAHNLVGAGLASLGQRDQARAAFEASLKADPRDAGTYTNLATLELQGGNVARARQFFAEALTIDPSSESARQGLLSLTSR
ncbi:MAG: fused MFS/spermidine synthase [Vicinamibacterales bacterium]